MKRLAILAIIVCAWFHLTPAHAQFNGCSSFCGTSSSAIADAPGFNNFQNSGSGPALACTYTPVTSGTQNVAYTGATPSASGGTPAYTFSETGALPTGLSINTSTGVISGTPSVSGSFPSIQVAVADTIPTTVNCGTAFTLSITTTFDPANKGTSITLSNGNLTATESTASGGIARSVPSHATGKFYAEFTLVSSTAAANVEIGIISGTGSLNSFLGPDHNSVGWSGAGTVFTNSGTLATIQTFAVGDVLSMAVDFGNQTIWFRDNAGNWNNSGTANPATNTGGLSISTLINSPFFAAVATGHSADSLTANYGGSAYSESVPSGFGNW